MGKSEVRHFVTDDNWYIYNKTIFNIEKIIKWLKSNSKGKQHFFSINQIHQGTKINPVQIRYCLLVGQLIKGKKEKVFLLRAKGYSKEEGSFQVKNGVAIRKP